MRSAWTDGRGGRLAVAAILLLQALPLLIFFADPALAGEAFVTDQPGEQVVVVDTSSMAKLATIPVDGEPAGIAVSVDGTRAYVTSPEGKSVRAKR